jgi:hypothetical protein
LFLQLPHTAKYPQAGLAGPGYGPSKYTPQLPKVKEKLLKFPLHSGEIDLDRHAFVIYMLSTFGVV